jgi:hypothetical protein
MQTKSIFSNGYAPAPAGGNLQRSTVMSQHNMSQAKTTHPMDMARCRRHRFPSRQARTRSTIKTTRLRLDQVLRMAGPSRERNRLRSHPHDIKMEKTLSFQRSTQTQKMRILLMRISTLPAGRILPLSEDNWPDRRQWILQQYSGSQGR